MHPISTESDLANRHVPILRMSIKRAVTITTLIIVVVAVASILIWYYVRPEIQFYLYWIVAIVITVLGVLAVLAQVTGYSLRDFLRHSKPENPVKINGADGAGDLVISDIQLEPDNEAGTCLVDFRVSNAGEADVLVNRVTFEVVDMLEIMTVGFMEFSEVYDLDISNLKAIGDKAQCQVAQLVEPGKADRFGVSLTAQNLGTGVFKGWKLLPTLLTNYGAVKGDEFELWLPYQAFSSIAEVRKNQEEFHRRASQPIEIPSKAQDEKQTDDYPRVDVNIVFANMAKIIRARLPSNAPMSILIPALVSKLSLAHKPLYAIYHHQSEKWLLKKETLQDIGVHEGDTLKIEAIVEPLERSEYWQRVVERRNADSTNQQKEYERVSLTIIAGEHSYQVELPAKVPMSVLVAQLAPKLGISADANYAVHHLESGNQLNGNDTFFNAGVLDGDTLRLSE